MMDMFTEVLLKRKRNVAEYFIMVPVIVLGVIVTLAYYVFLSGSAFLSGPGLAVVVLMWWGIYLLTSKHNLEFEYTITNSDVDIDMIIAKRKRKRLISFTAKEIQMMAPIDMLGNEKFDTEIDASAHDDRFDVYFIDVKTRMGRTKILVNPSEKMLEILRTFNPQNIVVGEEK